MEDKLEETIKILTDKAGGAKTATESQQYAQAALNLSQALIGLVRET